MLVVKKAWSEDYFFCIFHCFLVLRHWSEEQLEDDRTSLT